MATKGILDRIVAGPVADGTEHLRARREADAREMSHALGNSAARNAVEFAKLSRQYHHEAGGKYAAFRGKQLAPPKSNMVDANGRGVDALAGLDVLNQAYDN